MTRKLSQATLNTYYDYSYSGTDANGSSVPAGFLRMSDLRYANGWNSNSALQTFVPGYASTPSNVLNGHSVFFQAPLGIVSGTSGLGPLRSLINTCGFYLNFGPDQFSWPPFLSTAAPPPINVQYRYRLMEMIEPSDQLSVYGVTSGTLAAAQTSVATGTPSVQASKQWFQIPLGGALGTANASGFNHILASNVVALVILPKLSPSVDSTGAQLAPAYGYNSTTYRANSPSTNPFNQLPPIIQVTMVALDEVSAARLATRSGTTAPNLGISALNLFNNSTNYAADLNTLQQILQGNNPAYGIPGTALNYRVFTTDISIPAAKWSTNY
jgi:uncharacterized protein (TIGR02599 family)